MTDRSTARHRPETRIDEQVTVGPPAHEIAPRLLTIDEAAAYLGVSRRWLYDQVRGGSLRALQIARSWRIRPTELDRFADSFSWAPEQRSGD